MYATLVVHIKIRILQHHQLLEAQLIAFAANMPLSIFPTKQCLSSYTLRHSVSLSNTCIYLMEFKATSDIPCELDFLIGRRLASLKKPAHAL